MRTFNGLFCKKPFSGLRLLTVGNEALGVLKAKDSVVEIKDIIGLEMCRKTRIQGGDVLGLMDLTAGKTAMRHLLNAGKRKPGLGISTVAADGMTFDVPLNHGDYVTVTGMPVHAGNSSIGVHISVKKMQHPTKEMIKVSESFFTMVYIDNNLKSVNVCPAIELVGEEEVKLNTKYNMRRTVAKYVLEEQNRLQESDVKPSTIETAINAKKLTHVAIGSTAVTVNRLFNPSSLNINNTIFGREIFLWMEQHARHCAQLFTANENVVAVGMHSVTFSKPIFISDWVTLTATVVYVHNSTLEVDVFIKQERRDGDVITNRASFLLISLDETRRPRRIDIGLDLKNATLEERQLYAMTKYKYELGRSLRNKKQIDI